MNGEQLKNDSDVWNEYEEKKRKITEGHYEDEVQALCERLGI